MFTDLGSSLEGVSQGLWAPESNPWNRNRGHLFIFSIIFSITGGGRGRSTFPCTSVSRHNFCGLYFRRMNLHPSGDDAKERC